MKEKEFFFEQQKNFNTLENKLKEVINKCDAKNLVETIRENNYNGVLNVKNATSVDHYELENGLHVYVFLNDSKPINYLFSTYQLFEENFYGNGNIKMSDYKYVGGSALQYTIGGVGNSIPFGMEKEYYTEKSIAVLGPDFQDDLGVEMSMISGRSLQTNLLGHFLLIDCEYRDGTNIVVDRCRLAGDLEGFFATFKYNKLKKELKRDVVLEGLNSIFAKVNEIHLENEREKTDDKRGFLKKLLGKNRDLDRVIDAVSVEKRKVA